MSNLPQHYPKILIIVSLEIKDFQTELSQKPVIQCFRHMHEFYRTQDSFHSTFFILNSTEYLHARF